jgi:hypothetical protein
VFETQGVISQFARGMMHVKVGVARQKSFFISGLLFVGVPNFNFEFEGSKHDVNAAGEGKIHFIVCIYISLVGEKNWFP